ncbi:hypothetical protein F9C07_2204734 [Aspergillus flavus]|uniref:Aminoglycoside phosphotransferase domain-containing protein n=1 Tax=Aspergillus flavus (strain ATCC 200026 / FGSC A1120 / IAM 13836 / NRRL 3357 / JCM 12722 / SRRC 167) TaxID=332952 RepID=A0A7U2N0U5_ASPFN|nr:hypothetical protein F9C07_2204734 [Aspergillus flavus]
MAQKGLCWKEDEMGELVHTGTSSPDISVIRSLAMKHLPGSYDTMDVAFFAEGSFNKLYCVSSPHLPQDYLIRVALPVDPFFNRESEVATLAYIRKYTSIPVPKVLAFCSSSESELGFEWILMEKIGGVPLLDIWDEMPVEAKESLPTEICGYLKSHQDLQFIKIGSLYFSLVRERVGTRDFGGTLQAIPTNTTLDCGINTDFVIGRAVSLWFFRDKRLSLSADRDDFYSETDEVLAEEQDDVLDTCYSLEKLVSYIFPPPCEQYEDELLYHDDLSASNILVDPVSYHVTGIVD